MVGCIEVAQFGNPAAGAKRITSSPSHVYHQKSFSFTGRVLEILLGTDIIHKLYNFVFV